MINLLFIALGGAIGAVLRYLVGGLFSRLFPTAFPWGTLSVNLIGAFIIGFLWAIFYRIPVSAYTKSLILIGGIGAFTTFSTYSLETVNLFRDGEWRTGIINIVVSNIFGIVLVIGGFFLARYLIYFLSKRG